MFKSTVINLDVDTSNDFMLPSGKLYIKDAESIIDNVKILTEAAHKEGRVILSPLDAHYGTRERYAIESKELSIYGLHNIKGTPGAQKIKESLIEDYVIVPSEKLAPLVLKGVLDYQQIVLEKQGINLFYDEKSNQAGNQNVDSILQALKVKLVIVYGVVSHICVQEAALGALNRGIEVYIVTDAIKELDLEAHAIFIDLMVKKGARLVTTDEIVG